MDISVIGTGYVGLVTGTGFSEKGHKVYCVDIDPEKIRKINSGISPIYEKGLEELIKKNIGNNLKATMDLREAVMNSEITFICVGTPPKEDYSPDFKYLERASGDIGKILAEKEEYHTVVIKSTILPGTTEEIVIPLLEENSGKKAGTDFGVAMNPEFLREGLAVEDFMKPDRIVIGSINERSANKMGELYSGFHSPVIKTNIKTAEMIKYTSNTFLATKISFINEIGNICKKKGVDVYDVAKGIALDHRISPHFLNAGLGWGGSCFPKDLKALINEAEKQGYEPHLLNAVARVNEKQTKVLLDLAKNKIGGDFRDKRVAVLGLAFKEGTDDTRDSQAIPVIQGLLKKGAKVIAYDPQGEVNARQVFGEAIEYAPRASEALEGCELALVVTDWSEFENLDYSGMKSRKVIDARNIVKNREGIEYEGICW